MNCTCIAKKGNCSGEGRLAAGAAASVVLLVAAPAAGTAGLQASSRMLGRHHLGSPASDVPPHLVVGQRAVGLPASPHAGNPVQHGLKVGPVQHGVAVAAGKVELWRGSGGSIRGQGRARGVNKVRRS